jgi:hypothetical protein
MVRLMHRNSVGIMVNRNIDLATERTLKANACAATTRKGIHYQAHQTTPTTLSGSHRTKPQATIASGGMIQGPMNLIAR